jgi:rubrerythrin
MISKVPFDLSKLSQEDVDREALRAAIIAELDAVNLYEQLASMVGGDGIKKVLLDVAKEEKTHIGEFQAMLLRIDEEQERELDEGRKEIDELTGE